MKNTYSYVCIYTHKIHIKFVWVFSDAPLAIASLYIFSLKWVILCNIEQFFSCLKTFVE